MPLKYEIDWISVEMKLSVLMITYNHEQYIAQALDSVLMQEVDFDFEIVIGEDCSTDNTRNIVLDYQQKNPDKIRVLLPENNLGMLWNFVATYESCQGEYVALLEGDDYWSSRGKLQAQVDYLDRYPGCAICFHAVQVLDENVPSASYLHRPWKSGTVLTLRDLLAGNFIPNCSTMFKRGLFGKFPDWFFNLPQGDWSLHVMNAQYGDIGYIDDAMAVYRQHQGGVWTGAGLARRYEAVIASYEVFKGYLDHRYDGEIMAGTAACYWKLLEIHDLAGDIGGIKEILRKKFFVLLNNPQIRGADFIALLLKCYFPLIYSLVRSLKERLCAFLLKAGAVAAYFPGLQNKSSMFFFFPFFHIGGAEKVHADIVSLAVDKQPWISFTLASGSPALRDVFAYCGKLFNISVLTKSRAGRSFLLGYFARAVRRCKYALVFGANSEFFYELISHLHDGAYCVDVIHAFDGSNQFTTLPHVPRLDRRIVISRTTCDDLRKLYANTGLRNEFAERIDIVENKTKLPPDEMPLKRPSAKLRALYVGRGTPEKRVHLIGKIARMCAEVDVPLDVTLVGDVRDAIFEGDRQLCSFAGEIADHRLLDELYQESDVLLVSSSREGFPLAIMEAMVRGVIPIATDVGGISYHVKHRRTGFLVTNYHNEESVVSEFVTILDELVKNRELLAHISSATRAHGCAEFGGEHFDTYYRNLFQRFTVDAKARLGMVSLPSS